MIKRSIALIIMVLLLAQRDATAEGFTKKGPDIAMEARQNQVSESAFTVDIQMTLEDTAEATGGYQLRLVMAPGKRGFAQKLFMVDGPANLRGTALLINSREDGECEQWFYLSARKRVKRIRSCFQSCKFLNSEWTYEDMSGYAPEKYDHRLIGKETIEGRPCFKIEATLMDNQPSGYLKQVQWIDQKTYDLVKIEYYDHQKELLKTMTLTGHRAYSGSFRHARQVKVVNNKTAKIMQLEYVNFEFDRGSKRINLDKDRFYKDNSRLAPGALFTREMPR